MRKPIKCSRCSGVKRHAGRGLCSGCLNFLKRHGMPLPPKTRHSFEEWAVLIDTTAEGCWPWPGPITEEGYGSAAGPERQQPAHAVVYERTMGPIPAGLVIDHTCHNDTACEGGNSCLHRRCVRLAHLEAVKPGENTTRSHVTFSGVNARKTHCLVGHPLAGDNLVVTPTTRRRPVGQRMCRTCRRAQNRKTKQDQRDLLPTAVIRRWAGENGYPVGRGGPIPQDVAVAYAAATLTKS